MSDFSYTKLKLITFYAYFNISEREEENKVVENIMREGKRERSHGNDLK